MPADDETGEEAMRQPETAGSAVDAMRRNGATGDAVDVMRQIGTAGDLRIMADAPILEVVCICGSGAEAGIVAGDVFRLKKN